MTDRPMIFSAPMVRALLAGQKTQTRRLAGLTDVNERPSAWSLHNVGPLGYMTKPSSQGKFGATFESREIEPGSVLVCPQKLPCAPGDRLWVRETWAISSIYDGMRAAEINPDGTPLYCGIRYAANNERLGIKDRPSIHMPRWASRLTLLVTGVRVERLQDISGADAIAEGSREPSLRPLIGACWSEREVYAKLWEKLHGDDAWEANPWVAAITFTVERRNIDKEAE